MQDCAWVLLSFSQVYSLHCSPAFSPMQWHTLVLSWEYRRNVSSTVSSHTSSIKHKTNPKMTQWINLKGLHAANHCHSLSMETIFLQLPCATSHTKNTTCEKNFLPLSKRRKRFYKGYQIGTCGIFNRTGLAVQMYIQLTRIYGKCFYTSTRFLASNTPCKAI